MIQLKKLFSFLFISSLCLLRLLAQEDYSYTSAGTQTMSGEQPVSGTQTQEDNQDLYSVYAWNEDSSLFAYAKQNMVSIVSTKDSQIISKLETESAVKQLQFQPSSEKLENRIFIVTEEGSIIYYDYNLDELIWSANDYPELSLNKAAFNASATSIAAGYSNGTIVIYTQMNESDVFNQMILNQYESLGSSAINFLNFSRNSRYILYGDADGNLIIWDILYNMETCRFQYNTQYANDAFFTGDDKHILLLIDSLTAGIFDFEGQLVHKIQLEYAIKKIEVSANGKTIILVSNNNTRKYYNYQQGSIQELSNVTGLENMANMPQRPQEDISYPPFLAQPQEQSQSSGAALAQEGSQEKVPAEANEKKDALNKAEEKENTEEKRPPENEYHLVTINEEEETVQIEKIVTEPPVEIVEGKVETVLRYKNADNIDLGLKAGISPDPYCINIDLNAGYLTYKYLQPFYFGGFLDLGLSFPQKDFPYNYQAGSSTLPKPKIFMLSLYGSAGLCIYPFKLPVEVFADLSLGYSGSILWNGKMGLFNAYSSWYSSLYSALRVGGGYRGIKGYIEFVYTPVFGLNINIGIAYEIKLNI